MKRRYPGRGGGGDSFKLYELQSKLQYLIVNRMMSFFGYGITPPPPGRGGLATSSALLMQGKFYHGCLHETILL